MELSIVQIFTKQSRHLLFHDDSLTNMKLGNFGLDLDVRESRPSLVLVLHAFLLFVGFLCWDEKTEAFIAAVIVKKKGGLGLWNTFKSWVYISLDVCLLLTPPPFRTQWVNSKMFEVVTVLVCFVAYLNDQRSHCQRWARIFHMNCRLYQSFFHTSLKNLINRDTVKLPATTTTISLSRTHCARKENDGKIFKFWYSWHEFFLFRGLFNTQHWQHNHIRWILCWVGGSNYNICSGLISHSFIR